MKLDRTQMGAYLCIATNDVPPAVSKRITLNINFAPVIKVPNQLLGSPVGSDVTMTCHIEAYPNTINYWVKNRGQMLLNGPKHIVDESRHSYRVHLKLTVKRFNSSDVGTYLCVSTNSLGRAEGAIRLYGTSKSSQDDSSTFIIAVNIKKRRLWRPESLRSAESSGVDRVTAFLQTTSTRTQDADIP
ncbi:hypothetical protein AAG570_006576 [Ranatra chinensis]|uniref:Ig-like domain-containing protein n=1 Tax=Ranatra chinensis TaxID=642074 RepID=A0ABD0YWI0_9HEMI